MANIIHTLAFIQNWGEDNSILDTLKSDYNAVSIFHIMGRFSYLIDSNFDNKAQLEEWIRKIKSIKLSSGLPAVISLQTQKVIDVLKKKEAFGIKDYKSTAERFHFFMLIDCPHHDKSLIKLLKKQDIVHSILHIQGINSFIIEVISEDYDIYKNLLYKVKKLKSLNHIETLEVITVNKYRSRIIDEGGNVTAASQQDIRELYSL
jgi:hypothetical protein